MTIVGVDGCRGGWIAVWASADGFGDAHAAVHTRFADLLVSVTKADVIAVDMPIGFPDRIGGGGRGPEQALRDVLGARRPSVFSMPSRAAIGQTEYTAACRAARETSDPPRAISRQGFHLLPKVREIDELLRADATVAARVFETHPEGGFAALNGAPLRYPKTTAEGAAERRALLQAAGFPLAFLSQRFPGEAKPDDLFDACIACWSAARVARGEARAFPPDHERDSHGLPVVIWT